MTMKQPRFKRKYLIVCLFLVGVFMILYESLAFNALEKLRTPYIERNRFVTNTECPNATRRDESASLMPDIFEGLEERIVLKEFSGFYKRGVDSLNNKSVVNTVHYVWCSNRTFEFVNYLSVLSAWKVLQPDSIELHTEYAPLMDKYNSWLDDLVRTVPGFVIKPLPRNWDGDERGCGFWFGLAVLADRGGIYLDSRVIVQHGVFDLRQKEKTIFLSKQENGDYTVAMAMAQPHTPDLRNFRNKFDPKSEEFKDYPMCLPTGPETPMNKSSLCHVISQPLNPRDVFQLRTDFGAYVRKLLYGHERVVEDKPHLPGKIPKIVHYVWFGTKVVDFVMYLSMLSTLFVLNPDKVLVYTDGYMQGSYLERIKRDKRVVFVKREKPEAIFGKPVLYGQHRSDIVRAEVLLKYGGIYVDWDVLWLRDVNDVINQGHDVVANFDHMPREPWPETINLGVLMAKPKAAFIKRWQDALFDYKSKDFLYNAVELPYKIYERFPEYIHIERRLQVICFHLKCHPTFHPQFKDFSDGQPFDWRRDVYAIHFTYPDPPVYANEETCRNGTGEFAEIGRFILQHHSKLD